jgi:outer membrane biosynthesis protein TonB
LLLVICTTSKSSFTQFSRTAQTDLPDGVLGEMSYRMNGPLGDGRIAEALETGVRVFASAVADRLGFKVADLEAAPIASNSSDVAVDAPQPALVSAKNSKRSRRVAGDEPKPQATQPEEPPRSEPTPTETPVAEPTPTESPKSEPVANESPKTEESPDNETPKETKTTKPTSK